MINIKDNSQQKGFTLIEIMIALIIGLFLTAGAAQIFIGTKQTNRTQENLSRMQENARFAMYFLTEDIRNAGFDGGACGRGKILANAINHIDSTDPEYQFDTREVNGQALFSSLSGAVFGVNDAGINGSDSITIRSLQSFGSGAPLRAPYPATPAANLKILAADAGNLSAGDIMLVTDCKFSDIFQIVNNPSAGTLTHSVGGSVSPGNDVNTLSAAYGPNARVYRLSSDTGIPATTYSIANSGAPPVPGLTPDTQQLVPDIENMQILYGQRTDAGDTYYVPAGTPGLEMNEVVSVRVSLLVRSQDDFVATNAANYFYNGVTVSGAGISDSRLRKVYTSTIAIRNRLN